MMEVVVCVSSRNACLKKNREKTMESKGPKRRIQRQHKKTTTVASERHRILSVSLEASKKETVGESNYTTQTKIWGRELCPPPVIPFSAVHPFLSLHFTETRMETSWPPR